MADIIKKTCVFTVCLCLCVGVFLSSCFLLPVSAVEVVKEGSWVAHPADLLEYYSNETWTELEPSSTSEYIVDSVQEGERGWSDTFHGLTAYSSTFDLPITSFSNMIYHFNMTPNKDIVRLYPNADTIYCTFILGFSCSSTNFTYPDTFSLSALTWETNNTFVFSKLSGYSGNSAYALYQGTVAFPASYFVDSISIQWQANFNMGNQMQGYYVNFAYCPTTPIWTISYTEAEAVQQATLDIVANSLVPTVDNIQESAEKIIEGQEAIKDSIDKLPSAIVDEQQKAEESKAAEELEEYENAIEDNTSSILDQITEDSFPIMSITDSIGQLWSSVGSHSRTEGLVFPSIKIPDFTNPLSRTGSEIVLSEEQPVDIEGAINALPSFFVIIFRSFFTLVLGWGALKFLIDFIMSLFTPQEKGDNS